ncbi:MAG: DUF1028 domain-containing protein [Geminicoccaceae bacterium]
MTFSIVARCPQTRQLGVAVSSSSPAVAARCAHVRAHVGAVATQNITDPRLGPKLLDLLAHGLSPEEALATLARSEPHLEYRQLLLVDVQGQTAAHSGAKTLGTHAVAIGDGVVCGGNLLADPEVPARMLRAFGAAGGDLAERILAAMREGREAGPVHSAGLLVGAQEAWPLVDLRVDWSDGDPIEALAGLYTRWRPQMHEYVSRAIEPWTAPSFGVPGDP